MIFNLLLIECFIINSYATIKECNKFDTGMAEPKLENLWSNPFVFPIAMKYLKYKKHPSLCYIWSFGVFFRF